MAVTKVNIVKGGMTVAIGSDLGAVKDGATITATVESVVLDLEQEMVASVSWPVSRKFAAEFTLCEPTLANVKIGWDIAAATSGVGPVTLDFGKIETAFQERVIALTSFVPGGSNVRTITFHSAVLETPAAIVLSKRQEVNLKCGFNCLYNYGANNRVGQFSDA